MNIYIIISYHNHNHHIIYNIYIISPPQCKYVNFHISKILFQVLVFLKPDFYTLLHLNPFPVA